MAEGEGTSTAPGWQLTEAQYKHLDSKLDSLVDDMENAKTRAQRDKVRAKIDDIRHKLDEYEERDEDEDEDENDEDDDDGDDGDNDDEGGSKGNGSRKPPRRSASDHRRRDVKAPGRNKRTRAAEKKKEPKATEEPARGAFASWRKPRKTDT